MAPTDQIEARARFLQEAAHVLAASSPAAAAFIGRAHNKLIEDSGLDIPGKEADAFRRTICNACGNIMIPGWSCKVSSHIPGKASTVQDSNKAKKPPKLENTIRYTCLMCHRDTHQALRQKPRRKNEKPIPVRNPEPGSAPARLAKEVDNAPKTLNASSKQRQKARKGGLQAMLDKKKSQDSAHGGGLDLLDFAM